MPYQERCQQPIGIFTDGQNVYPGNCGDWGCEHCGYINKKRLRGVIEYGMTTLWANGEKTNYFVVTTSLDITASKFKLYWNRFMTSLRTMLRRQGVRDFRYMWTTEWGADNDMKHRHGIMNHRIPKKKYSELWEAASDGHCKVTYLRQTRSQKKAGYIVKYLAKDSQRGLFERGERRYGTSRNWPRAAAPEQAERPLKFLYLPRNSELLKKAMAGTDALAILADVKMIWPSKQQGDICRI